MTGDGGAAGKINSRAGLAVHVLRLLIVALALQPLLAMWSQEGLIFWFILLSGGVFIPLALPMALYRGLPGFNRVFLLSTLLLALSLVRFSGRDAALLALAWLICCVALALQTWLVFRQVWSFNPGVLCLAFAGVSPLIGSLWLVFHRANWFPLGFDPLIVLLTAAHFHHAGFTLPLMAGLNAKANPGCWTRFSCVAILVGVPLVAAGITCTHFGVLRFVEPFGVTVLVLGALGVAVSQIRRGVQIRSGLGFWTRTAFIVSGGSLLSAMILAMGFGLRHVVPNWALTMPQMWMIHGTLNAFGFGLCGLLAWRGVRKESGTGL